jgi:hypothetical protein
MRFNVSKLLVSRRPHSPSATGTGGFWGRWVMALMVVVIAVAVVAPTTVVPMVGGAVAVGPPTVGGDGSTAAVCQSGFACGGAPVALECQSGTACGGAPVALECQSGHGRTCDRGGVIVARVVKNAECQSGTACGG